VARTANHPRFDGIIVIDQRDPPPSRRRGVGRHRRRPHLWVRACVALALCGATAGAATAVVFWTAVPPLWVEVPVVFTEPGPIGSPALGGLEFGADALLDGLGPGEEPGGGAAVPAAPDRTDPGGTAAQKPSR
jgi:hypothetical protein